MAWCPRAEEYEDLLCLLLRRGLPVVVVKASRSSWNGVRIRWGIGAHQHELDPSEAIADLLHEFGHTTQDPLVEGHPATVEGSEEQYLREMEAWYAGERIALLLPVILPDDFGRLFAARRDKCFQSYANAYLARASGDVVKISG